MCKLQLYALALHYTLLLVAKGSPLLIYCEASGSRGGLMLLPRVACLQHGSYGRRCCCCCQRLKTVLWYVSHIASCCALDGMKDKRGQQPFMLLMLPQTLKNYVRHIPHLTRTFFTRFENTLTYFLIGS